MRCTIKCLFSNSLSTLYWLLGVTQRKKIKMSLSSTDLSLHQARMLYINGDTDGAIKMYFFRNVNK